jgi:hypothetical protein
MLRDDAPGGGGGALPPPLAPTPHHQGHLEFLRGSLAGIVNVAATYPLNKLISRQAYEGLHVAAAWRTILEDVRLGNLFRGVWPPLLQRTLASGAMFASYDFWFHQLRLAYHGGARARDSRAATDIRDEAWQVRVGAAFLAGSSEWLLTPLERTQTLLQHRKYTHVYATGRQAVQAMARVGPREFFRGGSAILLRNGPANALFFSLRDAAHDALPLQGRGGVWDALRDFLAAQCWAPPSARCSTRSTLPRWSCSWTLARRTGACARRW